MALAVGLSDVNTAQAWLNTLRGTSAATFTAVTTLFVQLHTAIPGAAGTNAVSSVTTRPALNFGAATTGGTQAAIATLPSWTNWAGTNGEIVTHISVWGAASAGTFYYSAALTASKTVNTGDTLNLTALTVTLSPIATT
jgi:hypothetical protein